MKKETYIVPHTKSLTVIDELMSGESLPVIPRDDDGNNEIDDSDDILAKPGDKTSVWD